MTGTARLPRSVPERQGISSTAFLSFLEAVHRSSLELHSFMVIRHGHVVAEGWWNPYKPELNHMMYSVTKTFTSAAIGLAVAEGYLKADDKVASFFPDDLPANPHEDLLQMTVHDVLAMATGFGIDTTGLCFEQEDGNWARGFFSAEMKHKPGTTFAYDSGASHILSLIVEKVTGETTHQYLKKRLMEPIGISGERWDADQLGHSFGGFGLSLTTEDFARMGLLYLNEGEWNGKRILPAEWIRATRSKQVSNGTEPDNDWHAGYGYQVWLCRQPNAYRLAGLWCQKCIVLPDQDAVVVVTSGLSDEKAVVDAVWDHLLPSMHDRELEPDEDANKLLQLRLSQLDLRPAGLSPQSPRSAVLSGRRFKLADNPLGWTSLAIRFENDTVIFDAQKETGSDNETILFGTEDWVTGSLGGQVVAGTAGWRLDDLLVARLSYAETPYGRTFELRFEAGGTLSVRVLHNVTASSSFAAGFTDKELSLAGEAEAEVGS